MPALIQSYVRGLAIHLTTSRKIAKILVKEQRAMHREFINSRMPNPHINSVGNIVFACWAVQSNALSYVGRRGTHKLRLVTLVP